MSQKILYILLCINSFLTFGKVITNTVYVPIADLRNGCLVRALTAIWAHTVICDLSEFKLPIRIRSSNSWVKRFQKRLRSPSFSFPTYFHPPTYPKSVKRKFHAAYAESMQTKLASEQIEVAASRWKNWWRLLMFSILITFRENIMFQKVSAI